MLTVRNYIIQNSSKDVSNTGYYDDLKYIIDKSQIDISKIATTNYNNLIMEKIEKDVTYLNGSATQWYDPYLNKIDSKENLIGKFIVPLIFTQSGTKPMTSILKSCEYVDLYRDWKEADYIIVVGFGFNKDDEHINGIVRTLINDDNKKVIVVGTSNTKEEIIKHLIVKQTSNIIIYNVDVNRKINNKLCIDCILDDIIK